MDNKENAKESMRLYRSGESKSLKEAWKKVKTNNNKEKVKEKPNVQ